MRAFLEWPARTQSVYFGDGCFRATEMSLEGREQSISLALTQRQMQ
jgi:hypothetical protein